VLVRGKVISAAMRVSPRKRMKIFEAALEDGTGGVKLVWFNQPYLGEQIRRGDRLAVFGAPRTSPYSHLQIESPDWEKFEGDEEEEGAIVPIYPKVGNIPPKAFRRLVAAALESLPKLDDSMPPAVRKRLGVVDLAPALEAIHRPPELDDAFLRYRSPAHRRVILQEFFTFQLAMRVRRATQEVQTKTRAISIGDELRAEVRRILPFRLTGAQKRVMREIADDLRGSRPMYRLLQGDVGSGKTIVALIAAIIMIRNGHTLAAGLREGFIQLAVGTHALLEERISFKSLGLAIVDEQHRFGVEQRQKLFAKGETPDILVMTATPIPRSLALAMYGDLELSVIDELPPGRLRIRTELRPSSALERVLRFVDDELAAGAQAYVVYPIIEESEKLNLKPLTQGFEAMQQRFPNRRVEMLHGRMSAAEKEERMERFKRGEIDILVSDLDKERLRLFADTDNGFELADVDLRLRGPGELLGTRQSGALRFRFANIVRDHDLLEQARDAAIELMEADGLERAEAVARELLGVPVPAAESRD
jgi:ATP-dependent DNA helicase RecG